MQISELPFIPTTLANSELVKQVEAGPVLQLGS